MGLLVASTAVSVHPAKDKADNCCHWKERNQDDVRKSCIGAGTDMVFLIEALASNLDLRKLHLRLFLFRSTCRGNLNAGLGELDKVVCKHDALLSAFCIMRHFVHWCAIANGCGQVLTHACQRTGCFEGFACTLPA